MTTLIQKLSKGFPIIFGGDSTIQQHVTRWLAADTQNLETTFQAIRYDTTLQQLSKDTTHMYSVPTPTSVTPPPPRPHVALNKASSRATTASRPHTLARVGVTPLMASSRLLAAVPSGCFYEHTRQKFTRNLPPECNSVCSCAAASRGRGLMKKDQASTDRRFSACPTQHAFIHAVSRLSISFRGPMR